MAIFLTCLNEIAQRKKSKLKISIAPILFLLIMIGFSPVFSQTDSTNRMITIKGQIRDENDLSIANVILINKQTKAGFFARPDGSFTVQCEKTDTLAITSLGFHSRNICYADSGSRTQFNLLLYLDTRTYKLATVEIFAPRELERIQDDINKLGYNERDFMLSGLNAVQSPITFLYQQFSKKEQSKRLVAYMENADRKRDLLKELFEHYVDYQIIELDDKEFDDFINYLNVSDEFLQSSSQYDFLIYVRDRFKDYKVQVRQQKILNDNDFNYDKD